ncbi:AfsR/SARP family transcriptional regulator, partial [Streptomyces sp. NRRL S-495]|uniref:AfsR/SARP family transcriptional regulator n=1 Tax=Streptomyces sp. NRRL S-495 TaxID=1609133 RepID=UPI0019010A87
MELRVLGPIEAEADSRAVRLPGGRARVLLAVLAVHHGRPVTVERLTDALWGTEPPATARARVHAKVAALRRAAAERDPARTGVIRTTETGYLLCAEAVDTDLGRFERLVHEGRAAAARQRADEAVDRFRVAHQRADAAVARFRAALALWRGPAFDGRAAEPLHTEAERLEEDRLTVLEECLDLELARSPRPDLVAVVRTVIRAHPLRESAHRLLMLALHRSGRTAEALTAYQEARSALTAELGVEPGAALQELHRGILAEDPALLLAQSLAPAGERPALPDLSGTVLSAPALPTPVPPAPVRAPLFGRDTELAELRTLLATRRLVTLVGPPGVG